MEHKISVVAEVQTKLAQQGNQAFGQARNDLSILSGDPARAQKSLATLKQAAELFKRMGMDVDKMTKTLSKGLFTPFKNSLQVLDKWGKGVQDVYKKVEFWENRRNQQAFARRKMAAIPGIGQMPLDQRGAIFKQYMGEAQGIAGGLRQHAGQMEMQGAELVNEMMAAEEMKAQQRSAKFIRGTQAVMAGIGVGAAAVQGTLSIEQRQAQNQASGVGFGKGLYDALAEGRLEGAQALRAMTQNPEFVKRLAMNAGRSSVAGNVAGIATGGVMTATGGVLTASGAGAFAGVPLMAAGAQQMGGGAMGLVGDDREARMAEAARQAISIQSTLDDRQFQRALNWTWGRTKDLGRRELMNTGTTADFAAMGAAGIPALMNADEGMALRDQMAQNVGYGKAGGAATFAMGTVPQLGIDAGAAGRFMSAGMISGKSAQSGRDELVSIIARGFALGFKDPNAKQALIEYATAAKESGWGSGNLSGLTGLAGYAAGPNATVAEQRQVFSAIEQLSNWMGGQSSGYRQARSFQIAGTILEDLNNESFMGTKLRGQDRKFTALEQAQLGVMDIKDFLDPTSKRIELAFGKDTRAAKAASHRQALAVLQDPIGELPQLTRIIDKYRQMPGNEKLSDVDILGKIADSGDADEFTRIAGSYLERQGALSLKNAIPGARALLAVAANRELTPELKQGLFGVEQSGQEAGAGEPGTGAKLETEKLKAALVEITDSAKNYVDQLERIGKIYQAGFESLSKEGGAIESLTKFGDAIETVGQKASTALTNMQGH